MILTKIAQIPGALPGQVSVHLDGLPIPSLQSVDVAFRAGSMAEVSIRIAGPLVQPLEMPMEVKVFFTPPPFMEICEEVRNGKRYYFAVKREN